MEERLGSLILATDISRQNNYLSEFRTHLDKRDLCLTNGRHRHFILQVSNVCQITKRAFITVLSITLFHWCGIEILSEAMKCC
jgi:hypothetical protein